MLVDIAGAALFFALGMVIGLNWRSLRPAKPRHATKAPEQFLYGKHKMAWFWMRHYDEDAKMRKLPLRTYARMKTET